jgi:low temperature requirement protein LtrA
MAQAPFEKAHDGYVQATEAAVEPVSKNAKILRRRQEENLPIFGDLVEHADARHLRYHEREDARNIELFFDLFFVAIFSTFTKNHEINSNEALSSYAVYFGVIWASWLQVCLYDVRFGFDSVFERATKAIQMCAFIGFASTTASLEMGPTPEVGKEAALSGFQSLNFLMIVSRALFAVQYAVAYVLVGRKHPPAKTPLLVTVIMYASASIIYGLLYKFVLLDSGNASGFYGYYAIIAFELSVTSLVVARYECVSFKETHLHKRLMVLTLMILGEGIIVCAFSFAKISSKTGWTPNSFGQALCVILSIVSWNLSPFSSTTNRRWKHYANILSTSSTASILATQASKLLSTSDPSGNNSTRCSTCRSTSP